MGIRNVCDGMVIRVEWIMLSEYVYDMYTCLLCECAWHNDSVVITLQQLESTTYVSNIKRMQ